MLGESGFTTCSALAEGGRRAATRSSRRGVHTATGDGGHDAARTTAALHRREPDGGRKQELGGEMNKGENDFEGVQAR